MLSRRSKYDELSSVSFKDNLLLSNRWSKSFHSWLIMDSTVPSFLPENKTLVSSPNWLTTDF